MATTSLFGTSGIRGPADTLFSEQFCFDLGRTFCQFLTKNKKTGPVAIGMDPRGSSPKIKSDIEKGIAFEGREIFDEGTTSVPSMCYLLQVKNYAGSLMVTGSHIKAYLNGVKFFAFREEIVKKHESQIEAIYYSLKSKVKPPKSKIYLITEDSAKEEYKQMLLALALKNYPSWKVVVDGGNGAQSDIMPQVLKNLGLEVIEFNTSIQGEFFARDTENSQDFTPLFKEVVRQRADFGIAYDSDGDRVIFVNKHGEFIPGDYTASLVAKEAASDTIITTIATSQVVDHIGKKIIRTKVGSPYIIEALKVHHSKFGFEPNGGGVSTEVMYTRDGGSTTIKFLNILTKSKKSFEELIATLPHFYLTKIKVDYEWELKDKIIDSARKEFVGIKIDETDGLKIWLDSTTWILFRSSLNAPEFRVFAESDKKSKADKLLTDGIALVRKIIKNEKP